MRPAARLDSTPLELCVIGAGNLGQAQAGHLASLGHSVRLYNRSAARLAPLQGAASIRLAGVLSGSQRLAALTTDLAASLAGARIAFIDVPATAHSELAGGLARFLKQTPRARQPLLVLHPGQTFGARHFSLQLRRAGLDDPPPICELQTAIYTSRLAEGGLASVLAVKRCVGMSVYPRDQIAAAEPLRALYPQVIPAPSTLHTGLTNLQGFIHPAVCLVNLVRIDRGERFRLYREGTSPALGALIEAADRERLGVAAKLGIRVPTGAQWFALSYGVQAATALEAVQKVPAYEEIEAPSGLATRLLFEDIPTGTVPILSLARALQVAAPAHEALLEMASVACGAAVADGAWTLEALELAGKSATDLRAAF